MPPRISNSAVVASSVSLSSASVSTAAWTLPRLHQQASAAFSTTARQASTPKARREFWKWKAGPGANLRDPKPEGGSNYITTRGSFISKNPFPLNPQFKSASVLSDASRELIWEKIMRRGETIKAVSAELGVDINRVAAVVRLKEVEKDWISKGKKLATPYAQAIQGMLPIRHFKRNHQNDPLENINELHIHPHTMKQLYWPTSESRHFTREDAAKAFHRKMLSADERVPHPELIQMERDLLEGKSAKVARERFIAAAEESERKSADAQVQKVLAEEKATTRINTKRFEFRFREINAEDVGPTGRKVDAVGARYGRPSYDRVKGAVKIPTSVP